MYPQPTDETSFAPGTLMLDTTGRAIRAHSGHLFWHDGLYRWIGQRWTRTADFRGISLYDSPDLMRWTCRGHILNASNDPAHRLYRGRSIERPKVLRSPATGRWVLWAHAENRGYSHAHALVAQAERLEGPFEVVGEFRPGGAEFRDMSLFLDDDGRGYVLYASQNNTALHIDELTPDLLNVTGRRCVFPGRREAPVMFRRDGRCHLITSGTTGFAPNPLLAAVADHPLGPWTRLGNPCIGIGAESAFNSQPFSIFPLPRPGQAEPQWVYVGDRWNIRWLADSRYVFLPIDFDPAGRPRIEWTPEWSLTSRAPGSYRETPTGPTLEITPTLPDGNADRERPPLIAWKPGAVATLPRTAALAWLAWSEQSLVVEVLVYGHPDAMIADAALPLWDQPGFELFLNHYQLAAATDAEGQTLVAPGMALDEEFRGMHDAGYADHVRIEVRGGATNENAGRIGFAESDRGVLYRLCVRRARTLVPYLASGETMAFCLVVKLPRQSPEGGIEKVALPADRIWGDTDSYCRIGFAGKRVNPPAEGAGERAVSIAREVLA